MKLNTNMVVEQSPHPIVLGYYPVRAKAQLCRLLCEYLHVDYIDQHLNPSEWDELKHNQAKDWIIKDLPFLVDGDFVVTGSTGCSYYVIQKANRCDLFGRTIEDSIKITSFGNRKDLHSAVLGLICKIKTNRTIEQTKQLKHYWAAKIEPILQNQEKEARENDWYFGYISLMDFIIYLVITQLQQTFPEQIKKFKKLNALKQRFAKIPEIQNYENSTRAVKCYNPVEYFNNYKEQMMKTSGKLFKHPSMSMDLE